MSILPLVQIEREEFGNKNVSLRQPCRDVVSFDHDFQKKVEDLLETFWSHNIAVGLAAPQIGIQLRLAVINYTREKSGDTFIIINPKVLSTSGKKDKKKESCMSVPGYAGEVERRKKIAIEYQDRFGQKKTLVAEGFMARVIQHEIDHLEGVLYIDQMENISKLERTDLFKND